MVVSSIPVSTEDNFGDPIEIRVDVIHHVSVASTVFPASTIVMRLAQHGEAIRGIQEHLLEVPIQEEVRALRDKADITEAERAILRTTIRMMGAVETILRNHMRDERQTHIDIERQLALVQEELDRVGYPTLRTERTSRSSRIS
ncbi:hypothetical protein Tco_1515665 [Tanacetum coccineum]